MGYLWQFSAAFLCQAADDARLDATGPGAEGDVTIDNAELG
jgi:hypothetical protein